SLWAVFMINYSYFIAGGRGKVMQERQAEKWNDLILSAFTVTVNYIENLREFVLLSQCCKGLKRIIEGAEICWKLFFETLFHNKKPSLKYFSRILPTKYTVAIILFGTGRILMLMTYFSIGGAGWKVLSLLVPPTCFFRAIA